MQFHDCPRTVVLDGSQPLKDADRLTVLLRQLWAAGPKHCHFIVWTFQTRTHTLRTVHGMN